MLSVVHFFLRARACAFSSFGKSILSSGYCATELVTVLGSYIAERFSAFLTTNLAVGGGQCPLCCSVYLRCTSTTVDLGSVAVCPFFLQGGEGGEEFLVNLKCGDDAGAILCAALVGLWPQWQQSAHWTRKRGTLRKRGFPTGNLARREGVLAASVR